MERTNQYYFISQLSIKTRKLTFKNNNLMSDRTRNKISEDKDSAKIFE